MNITFLGATGTVTGSRYLLLVEGKQILVDCGLFQGVKQLRLRNREPLAVDVRELRAVILTHAHLDHSGYLPALVRSGFRGPVYCTPATRDLLGVLLPDSGHLLEEEAAYANRAGYSKHHPALPLYTRRDAEIALERLVPVPFENPARIGAAEFAFHPAGHILGAAMVSVRERAHLLFSGDLGRPHDPLLPSPATPEGIEYLVLESTYGGRTHPAGDPLEVLGEVIRRTAARGGAVLIPSFAVGRAQHLLFLLHKLKQSNRIPGVPIFLDSPMSSRATAIFATHRFELRLGPEEARSVMSIASEVETVAGSKEVDLMPYPRVILSASGMATGGRVLHHLKALVGDPRNTVLFAGYQAAGTRGAAMVAGASSIKIHGKHFPVRAEVLLLDGLSAHADEPEILEWLRGFRDPPIRTFITHGEPVAADSLRRRIEESLGWEVRVPDYRESYPLPARDLAPDVEVPQPLPTP